MDSWEIILAVVLVLLLFSTGLLLRPAVRTSHHAASEFVLWVAQGFGIGRVPWAPGTFGSILGIGWFGLLLASRRGWIVTAGLLAAVAFSVRLCGLAEKHLGRKDPGSVVMDEIAAMPFCFLTWVWLSFWRKGLWPEPVVLFSHGNWLSILGVFACFRLFDVWKPWPVRQSQDLPGGWGITVDDLLAAVYVNVTSLLVYLGKAILGS